MITITKEEIVSSSKAGKNFGHSSRDGLKK